MSPANARVAITGLGLWLPGYPSAQAWAAGEHDPELPKATGRALDRLNRRRAGHMGRAIADSAAEAMEAAGADPGVAPTVVGSAIGEATTMIGLLDQMWRDHTPMSPAAFTVSVHNAASGLMSISAKNRGYTTSMAADFDTPAMALFEGIGLVLERREPVLVVCADEAPPVCLVEGEFQWELLAGAVVLAPEEGAGAPHARIEVLAAADDGAGSDEERLPPADLDDALAHNPQVGIVDLIGAVLRREPGRLALDRGAGHGYEARLTFVERG